MIRVIKSYLAYLNWIKAHGLWGDQFQSLALVSIRKAVCQEPDERIVPKYLELQGQIESSIGKKKQAFQSFKTAKEIIEKHPAYFLYGEMSKLKERIRQALLEIEREIS